MLPSVENINTRIQNAAKRIMICQIAEAEAAGKVPDLLGRNEQISPGIVTVCKKEYDQKGSEQDRIDVSVLEPYAATLKRGTPILYVNCITAAENQLNVRLKQADFPQYIQAKIQSFLKKATDIGKDCKTYAAVLRCSRKASYYNFSVFGFNLNQTIYEKRIMECLADHVIRNVDNGITKIDGMTVYRNKNRFVLQRNAGYAFYEIISIPKGFRYDTYCGFHGGYVETELQKDGVLSDGSVFNAESFIKELCRRVNFETDQVPVKEKVGMSGHMADRHAEDIDFLIENKDCQEFLRKFDRYGFKTIDTYRNLNKEANGFLKAFEGVKEPVSRCGILTVATLQAIILKLESGAIRVKEPKCTIHDIEIIVEAVRDYLGFGTAKVTINETGTGYHRDMFSLLEIPVYDTAFIDTDDLVSGIVHCFDDFCKRHTRVSVAAIEGDC